MSIMELILVSVVAMVSLAIGAGTQDQVAFASRLSAALRDTLWEHELPPDLQLAQQMGLQETAAVTLAWLGDVDGAVNIAQTFRWEVARERTLSDIAVEGARHGDAEAAKWVLNLMADESLVGPWYRLGARNGVAIALAKAGDQQEAAGVAEPLPALARATVLREIGETYRGTGQNTVADQTFREAVAAARVAGEGTAIVPALLDLAQVQYALGDVSGGATSVKEALSTARTIQGISDRVDMLLDCARVQRKLGDAHGADATLGESLWAAREYVLVPEQPDGDALYRVALAYSSAGQLATAGAVFREAAGKAKEYGSELARIAKAQAAAGLFEDGMETARQIAPEGSSLLDEHYSSRGLGLALREDEAGPTPEEEEAYWLALGRVHAEAAVEFAAGKIPEGIKSYRRYTESVGDDPRIYEIVMDCFRREVQRGALWTASAIAVGMLDSAWKAEALLTLATCVAKEDGKDQAAVLAGSIDCTESPEFSARGAEPARFSYKEPRTWGLYYLEAGIGKHPWTTQAYASMAAELAGAAMRFEQTIGPPPDRDYAAAFQDFDPIVVRALARAHAETGDPHQALDWCLKITDPEKRLAGLIGLAEGITGQDIGLTEWEKSRAPQWGPLSLRH
jgi:tetratricopeptide (TPR) repeat protein